MLNWKTRVAVLAIALTAAFTLSCSSDDNGAEASEQSSSGGGGGDGNATLTIGDETWTFSGIHCGFSPEENGNDRVSFTLSAFGESAEGVRIQLDATIQDTDGRGRYQGEGVIHVVSLDDIEDFENPSVAWGIQSGFVNTQVADIIQVDGKRVTVSGEFDDGRTDSELEAVPGTLEATCP